MPGSPPGTSPTITARPRISSASFAAGSRPQRGAERLAGNPGVHQVGAASRADDPRASSRMRSMSRVARMGVDRLDLLAIPLVGLSRPALSRRARPSRRPAARGQDPPSGADQFRHRAAAASSSITASAIVSNQVQYSLIDRRPEARMAAFCARTWGEPAGLRHLARRPAVGEISRPPRAAARPSSPPPRLQKYKQMIDAWGGWALFQELLAVLRRSPTSTASASPMSACAMCSTARRWLASSSGRGSGWRSTSPTTLATFGFALDADDLARIEAVLAKSRDLMQLIGDCGDEYR